MGESNTVVSAYTLYGHLQQYCSHPLIRAVSPLFYSIRKYNAESHNEKKIMDLNLKKNSSFYFFPTQNPTLQVEILLIVKTKVCKYLLG